MVRTRAACISCVPCDIFSRNTLTPPRSSWSTRWGVSLAGPRVATILVFGICVNGLAQTLGMNSNCIGR